MHYCRGIHVSLIVIGSDDPISPLAEATPPPPPALHGRGVVGPPSLRVCPGEQKGGKERAARRDAGDPHARVRAIGTPDAPPGTAPPPRPQNLPRHPRLPFLVSLSLHSPPHPPGNESTGGVVIGGERRWPVLWRFSGDTPHRWPQAAFSPRRRVGSPSSAPQRRCGGDPTFPVLLLLHLISAKGGRPGTGYPLPRRAALVYLLLPLLRWGGAFPFRRGPSPLRSLSASSFRSMTASQNRIMAVHASWLLSILAITSRRSSLLPTADLSWTLCSAHAGHSSSVC